MIGLLAAAALAQDVHVVRRGETVASIAAEIGLPRVAREIRTLNGLRPGEEPLPGTVLTLPDVPGTARPGGLVLWVGGSGTLAVPGEPVAALVEGQAVPVGLTVCTAVGASATVRLAIDVVTSHHDDVVLLPDTCFTLDATSVWGARRASTVSMARGTMSIRTAADPGAVHVRTVSGVTSGDAGGFRVTVEPEAARTEAWFAPVAVMGAGRQVDVPTAFGTRVRPGQAPEDPTALPPPGTPTWPVSGAELRRAAFEWTSVDRALGYRVEMGPSDAFESLLYGEEVPTASFAPDFLLLTVRVPELWWRVSSVDRTGFVGVPSKPSALRFPEAMAP